MGMAVFREGFGLLDKQFSDMWVAVRFFRSRFVTKLDKPQVIVNPNGCFQTCFERCELKGGSGK